MRNLQSLQFLPHPSINFIVGPNGSGKTSLLEAISLLSTGKSFRTPQIRKVIQYDQRELTVFGELMTADNQQRKLGIMRAVDGSTLVKIDGQRRERLADLALMLPVVSMEANSFSLLDGGSEVRREVLDWGLFHVEHQFLPLWKRYRAVLEQRNALLRSGNDLASLPYWDAQLAALGTELDNFRQVHFQNFSEILYSLARNFFGITELSLGYQSGWNKEAYSTLEACLLMQRQADIERGYSFYGPHRADMDIRWQGKLARDICSRGQKKLVSYVVGLAKVMLYRQTKGCSPLLLLDDLPAELDWENIQRISRFLSEYPCQSFITAINKDTQNTELLNTFGQYAMFHVEHGQLVQPTSIPS